MKNTKNQNRAFLILGILFVVYSVIAFAVPFRRNGVFAVSYIFTVIAFGAQFYTFRKAFAGGETVKSKFYGFPIAQISVVYLAVQAALSLVFMAIAGIAPLWVALIAYVLILAIAAIGLIAADVMRNEIERQDSKLKADVTAMRSLQSRVNMLSEQNPSAELKSLADKFRYSDPVSNPATTEAEQQLEALMNDLESAVTDGDSAAVTTLCKTVTAALNERNRLCKLNK